MFLEEGGQLLVDDALHDPLNVGVAQFGFGLTFKLGVGQAHTDDRGDPLADVVTLQAGALLGQVVGAGVGVDRAGQRRAEAAEVGTALDGVYTVGEGEDVFGVAVGVLHGHLDADAVLLLAEENDFLVEDVLLLVEILDELRESPSVVKDLTLVTDLVDNGDAHTRIEEGQFAKPPGQHLVTEGDLRKDLRVGFEGDAGAGVGGLA